jgi:hypothetical protein
VEGPRARVRSDLPPEQAQAFLARLETLELALDSAFPWLPPAEPAPLTLVLGDAARFALVARDHGVEASGGAFSCRNGEVVLRYREGEWLRRDGPPFALEPRVRPLAAACLRRRLERFEGLEETWLEEGLVLVFVELAAVAFEDTGHAVRQNRERLLDAFLPTYLGGKPALARLVAARGPNETKRAGSAALAWAALRFMLADAELTPFVELGLRQASGAEVDVPWKDALAVLAAREDAFERYLLEAVLRELLLAFRDAPTPVDRWEAAAALRLIANVDLDTDAGAEKRAALVRATEAHFAEQPVATRFLARFDADLRLVNQARSRLQAQARLSKIVRKEFVRRAAGYGHPAVERARRDLGRALQRALEARR